MDPPTDPRKMRRGGPVLCASRFPSPCLPRVTGHPLVLPSVPLSGQWAEQAWGLSLATTACASRVFNHGGRSGPFLFSSTFTYTNVLCSLTLYS